jgi:hypothetical protein
LNAERRASQRVGIGLLGSKLSHRCLAFWLMFKKSEVRCDCNLIKLNGFVYKLMRSELLNYLTTILDLF